MRAIAAFLVTGAAVVLAGGRASAEDAGPSIDEMFEAVSGAEAPGPGRPHAEPPKPDGASRPPKEPPPPERRGAGPAAEAPASVADDLKAARARAIARANFYNRQSKPWHLAMTWVSLGEHRKAVSLFDMMIRKRMYNVYKSPVKDAARIAPDPLGSYGEDGHMERLGIVQIEYARALVVLGHEKPAGELLADAAARRAKTGYVPWGLKDDLVNAQKFAAGYGELKARLEALEASLAEAPDPDKLWELAQLCNRAPGKAGTPLERKLDIPLKRLEALLTIVAKYPGSRRVAGGDAHLELNRAWRVFEVHEKCVEVLDEMMAKHLTNYYVRHGSVLWEKAEALARLGVLREELGMRDALGAYRGSLDTFEAFRQRFPQDQKCKPGDSGVSAVQGRISTLDAAVGRFSR